MGLAHIPFHSNTMIIRKTLHTESYLRLGADPITLVLTRAHGGPGTTTVYAQQLMPSVCEVDQPASQRCKVGNEI